MNPGSSHEADPAAENEADENDEHLPVLLHLRCVRVVSAALGDAHLVRRCLRVATRRHPDRAIGAPWCRDSGKLADHAPGVATGTRRRQTGRVTTIPPFKLVPQPLSPEAESLLKRPAGVWEELGERHRLGGEPSLRNSEWPSCSACRSRMTFYAQLDGLPKPSSFDLADAGLILVYVCFDCFQVAAALDTY